VREGHSQAIWFTEPPNRCIVSCSFVALKIMIPIDGSHNQTEIDTSEILHSRAVEFPERLLKG
jgi:hypothetical protein